MDVDVTLGLRPALDLVLDEVPEERARVQVRVDLGAGRVLDLRLRGPERRAGIAREHVGDGVVAERALRGEHPLDARRLLATPCLTGLLFAWRDALVARSGHAAESLARWSRGQAILH